MVWFDRALSILLILGGIGHTIGSIRFYWHDPLTMLWALSASLFVFLFGAMSLLRASRPSDVPLAWICLASGLCWILAALRFGYLIGNLFDPRAIIFAVITLGMCAFSVRSIVLAKR
jgi:hypothetical protein